MPYIIGIDLAYRIRQLQASSQGKNPAKLVLISGDNISTMAHPLLEQNHLFDEVLQKPFTIAQLKRLLVRHKLAEEDGK